VPDVRVDDLNQPASAVISRIKCAGQLWPLRLLYRNTLAEASTTQDSKLTEIATCKEARFYYINLWVSGLFSRHHTCTFPAYLPRTKRRSYLLTTRVPLRQLRNPLSLTLQTILNDCDVLGESGHTVHDSVVLREICVLQRALLNCCKEGPVRRSFIGGLTTDEYTRKSCQDFA
jgi:hypothetical protein